MRSSALKTESSFGFVLPSRAGGRRVAETRPIDLVHLTRQTFGDKRLETELLRLFMRQARQIQAGLDAACGDDAVSCLPAADLLHTLIGSARVVGAHRVAALAQGCEAALRTSGKDAPSENERVRPARRRRRGLRLYRRPDRSGLIEADLLANAGLARTSDAIAVRISEGRNAIDGDEAEPQRSPQDPRGVFGIKLQTATFVGFKLGGAHREGRTPSRQSRGTAASGLANRIEVL